MTMECLLCSSSSSSSSATTTATATPEDFSEPSLSNNPLSELDTLTGTGSKFAACLCQLLGLPVTPFHQHFLQPNIGFCSSCTQFLSTVNSLFDQLGQLQRQIQESMEEVSQRLCKLVDNDDSDGQSDNDNTGGSASTTTTSTKASSSSSSSCQSTRSLRRQVVLAAAAAAAAKASNLGQDQGLKQNTPEQRYPDPGGILVSSGVIVDDTFKEEPPVDAQILTQGDDHPLEILGLDLDLDDLETLDNSAANWSPPDPVAPEDLFEDLDGNLLDNSSSCFSSSCPSRGPSPPLRKKPKKSVPGKNRPGRATKSNPPKLSKKLEGIRHKLCGTERNLAISLTRLGENELKLVEDRKMTGDKNLSRNSGTKARSKVKPVKVKPEVKVIPSDPKVNDANSEHDSGAKAGILRKALLEIEEREKFFRQKLQLQQKSETSELSEPESTADPSSADFTGAAAATSEKVTRGRIQPRSQPKPRIRIPKTSRRRGVTKVPPKTIPCSSKFPDCPEKFRTAWALRVHLKKSHSVPREPLECPHCGKVFRETRKLVIHARLHTGELPFVCQTCQKGFRAAHSLRDHVVKMHTGEKSHRCPHPSCTWAFVHPADLKSHLRSHDPAARDFLCELCPHRSRSKPDLTNHQAKAHAAQLHLVPFKCSFCAKEFSSGQYLRSHEKSHRGTLPLQCHLCPFRCDRRANLDAHFLSHSDERGYSCDHPDCGKTFKHKGHLVIHRRTHTGERPYKCPTCPKDFKDSTHLKRHVAAIHSGLKPLKCPFCEEHFALRKYMSYHAKTKHKGQQLPEGGASGAIAVPVVN